MPTVRISAKSARQPFHGCEPDYMRDVCFGACCRSSKGPILVTLLPREAATLGALGAEVDGGRLAPTARRCPAQAVGTNLCDLHGTDLKPFGCIASPFMLTNRDTLIIRNRYRLLRCYRDGEAPAYRAFSSSLRLLFGDDEAERVTAELDGGSGDFYAWMESGAYRDLRAGDAAKRGVVVDTSPQEALDFA